MSYPLEEAPGMDGFRVTWVYRALAPCIRLVEGGNVGYTRGPAPIKSTLMFSASVSVTQCVVSLPSNN